MKTALITGASSGLGREFVLQCAKRYPDLDGIWIVARHSEALSSLADLLPQRVRVLPLDLSEMEDLRKLSGLLEEERPDIRLLINAAGYGLAGRAAQMDVERQTGMVDVNCRALTYVTLAALPYMHRDSRILEIASASAFLPQPRFAVYAACKSYVYSFSRAIREELRERGICVTAVCPGPVDTPFLEKAMGNRKLPSYKRMILKDPEHVVRRALADAERGKALSVCGMAMRAGTVAVRLVPHGLSSRFYYRFGGRE